MVLLMLLLLLHRAFPALLPHSAIKQAPQIHPLAEIAHQERTHPYQGQVRVCRAVLVLTQRLPDNNFATCAAQAPMDHSLARVPGRIAGCAQ